MLRRVHPAWRLLAAEHAPLVVGFLHHSFIQPNKWTLPRPGLVLQLDDYLHHVREQVGQGAFPKRADQYLDDWASDDHAWLRKFYPANDDQPHFDITPATEKAFSASGTVVWHSWTRPA